MPVIIILAPQFWHLGRLSMSFSGLGTNWGWGMGSSCFRRERYRLSATDAWHRAEPVMRHVKHLSLESLVKMDHFQKEPTLNLKEANELASSHSLPQLEIRHRTGSGYSAGSRFGAKVANSALPPKADMCVALAHVRFGPIADISQCYSITSSARTSNCTETFNPSLSTVLRLSVDDPK